MVTCQCPGMRPVSIATFRNAVLVDVVLHHVRPCPIGDEELDRVNWAPRPAGPVIVYTQPPKPWWQERAERAEQKRPVSPQEPAKTRVRRKPHSDPRTPARR